MRSGKVLIAPSVLAADFSRMGEEIKKIELYGGEWVHLDIMDGHFVPNISFGPKMVADIRNFTNLTFDVHLMTNDPDHFVGLFAEAGADYITFHLETTVHAHRTIEHIKKYGKKVGVSIVPSTPICMLQELLSYVDLVLIMTVDPGFGGQKMIFECLEKVRSLARSRNEAGHSFLLAVDGGVNAQTAPLAISAGAEVLVVGSAFFASADPSGEIATLKGNHIV